MILPFPAIDAAFKASTPRGSVAILFLIEDSSTMSILWPRMRDFYLPKVLSGIKDANPSIPIQVLWMPTSQLSPINCERTSSSRRPRRWNDIPSLTFSQHSSNKISSVAISCAIDALVSAFGQTQAIRHLVVIAASNPAGESPTRPNTLSWIPLVHRLHQEDTRLHMIVRSQHNMEGLTSLFWETVKNDFSKPSVTDDTHYVFYLRNEAENNSQSASDSTPNSELQAPAKSMSLTSSSSRTSSSSSVHRPSLVFQLQKMNGMEKKRRSRARREPVTPKSKPYQKTYPNIAGTQSSSSRPESSPQSAVAHVSFSGHTIDDVVNGAYDTHSRGTSSEDNASYSATTSPTRSLSPPSPRYSSTSTLTSSPGMETQCSPFHHLNPLPNMSAAALHQPVTSSTTPNSLSPAPGYHEPPTYKLDSTIGPIRSHYHATHHVNPRGPRTQALAQPVGGSSYAPLWRQSQREPSDLDMSFQHIEHLTALDTTNTSVADASLESPYLSSGGYSEVSADLSLFYSEYEHGTSCYQNSEGANAESINYTFSMHSSSLHPPPVSFFR